MAAVRKNVFYMLAAHFANYIVPLLTFPYLAVHLGTYHFGMISIGTAISFYGVVLIDWGFGISGAKLAADTDDKIGISELFWDISISKLMIFPIYIIGAAAYLLVYGGRDINIIALIMSISTVANIINFAWLLQGRQNVGILTGLTTLFRLSSAPIIFFFVHGPSDSWKAALALSWPALAVALSSIVICKSQGYISHPRVNISRSLSHLRDSFSLFVANASANIYTTANILIIGAVYGPYQTGIYSAADRVRSAAQNLVIPIGQAAFPQACRLMKENRSRGFQFARKIMFFQVCLIGLGSLFLILFSHRVILTVLGERYVDSEQILKMLLICPVLVSFSNAVGMQVLLPLGFKDYFAKVRVFAGAVGLLAAVIAVKWVGFSYVAASTVFAELVILLSLYFRVRNLGFRIFGAP